MAEEVLDLRSLETLCGDYAVHIYERLEAMERGGRLRVIAPREQRDLLEAALETLTSSGVARLIDEHEEGDAIEVVLERL